MKALMLLTVLMAAVIAQAAVKDYKVVCQKPDGNIPYSFTGEGTVTYDEAQDLSQARPSEKHREYHVIEGKAGADMDFVISTPEGTFAVRDAYVSDGNVYTIPALALMYRKSFLVKLTGSSSRGSGELHMLLQGPSTGGTSKIIAGGRIYWSNCQITE